MRRRTTVLRIVLAVTLAAIAAFALAISHDSACTPPVPVTGAATSMKAIRHHCYGGPDVLTLEDVARPTPADNEVLVKVHAASVNPLDWHYMRGKPYVMRLSSGFGARLLAGCTVLFTWTAAPFRSLKTPEVTISSPGSIPDSTAI